MRDELHCSAPTGTSSPSTSVLMGTSLPAASSVSTARVRRRHRVIGVEWPVRLRHRAPQAAKRRTPGTAHPVRWQRSIPAFTAPLGVAPRVAAFAGLGRPVPQEGRRLKASSGQHAEAGKGGRDAGQYAELVAHVHRDAGYASAGRTVLGGGSAAAITSLTRPVSDQAGSTVVGDGGWRHGIGGTHVLSTTTPNTLLRYRAGPVPPDSSRNQTWCLLFQMLASIGSSSLTGEAPKVS